MAENVYKHSYNMMLQWRCDSIVTWLSRGWRFESWHWQLDLFQWHRSLIACLLGASALLLSIDSDHANSGLKLFNLQILLPMSPQTTNTQWRHKSKKSEKFGPNVADKCASAITKNLGWGCNSWPCSADNFLIMHSSSALCIHFLICYLLF